MKTCRKCKRDFPLEAFNRNRSKPDGLDNYCQPCRLAYNNAWNWAHGVERSPTFAGRVMSRFVRGSENECWEWRGQFTSNGYGMLQTRKNGRSRCDLAHRLVYTMLKGEIPAGLQIDHLCRNTRCVNPAHLEPVTPKENMRRARAARGVA